jgi:methylmalonyl-CoA/ethylmalonyl-CoA epimerase
MSLKRLDHIAFRVHDIDPVVAFYTANLGFQVVQEMEMDIGGSKAHSKVLNLPGVPYYIFVDQGLDEDNIISRWVKQHGSGLHHMAYLVDNIASEADRLKKSGLVFTTDHVVDTGGGLKQLFTRPHPVTGVITEIIERYEDNVFFVQENVIQLIQSTEGL